MMVPQILQTSVLILLPALGALLAERSGILNIGVEGMIGFGAFTAILSIHFGASVPVAIFAGAVSGLIPALIFNLFALRFAANIFIVGLALNLLSVGILPFFSELFFSTRGVVQISPAIASLPYAVLVGIAVTWAFATWVILYYTRFGLRVRIAGEESEWLRTRGVDPGRIRSMAMLFSGISAGLAGALLSLRIGAYLPGISAGRGWIALVVIYLGYRSVPGLVAAAVLFGSLDALAVRAQALLDVPPTILLALPYVLTLVAFVTYSAFRTYSR